MDIVEEIKSRINIEQLVSQYVQLKPAGKSLKGLCPFHDEKTPSFIVSPEKQIAWCFGCQKGGDIFNFIETVEACDFREAVNILADKVGIDLAEPKYKEISLSPAISKDKRDVLVEIHTVLNEFYVENLLKSTAGTNVIKYLSSRGLSEEMIKVFSIGLSPDSFKESYQYLLQKGFQKRDIIDSGLVGTKDTGGGEVYDKFRLRLMFPIKDPRSRIVGFGGRVLRQGDEPKYLNSPETVIYNKSKILYGFDLAKDEIKKHDMVVLVEGYMDVIASFQAGVRNVVASSGTALTEDQLKHLKRFTQNIILLFDSDLAGQKAAVRAIEIAQKLNMNVYMARVKEGKDPGDYAIKDPEGFQKLIADKTPYLNFYASDLREKYNLDSLEENKQAQAFILPILAGISDKWEKEEAIKIFSLFFRMSKGHLADKVRSFVLNKSHLDKSLDDKVNSQSSLTQRANERALEYLLGFDELLHANMQDFLGLLTDLSDLDLCEPLKGIYNKIQQYYNSAASVHDILKFDYLDREQKQYLQVIQLKLQEEDYSQEKKELIFQKALAKLRKRANYKRRINFKIEENIASEEVLGEYVKHFIN